LSQCFFSFVRLRINSKDNKVLFNELENASIVRELHVYGQVVRHDTKSNKKIQHQGLGKKLMSEAEKNTKKHKLNKVAVISGIGVRGYYKKLGYKLEGTYMTKNI